MYTLYTRWRQEFCSGGFSIACGWVAWAAHTKPPARRLFCPCWHTQQQLLGISWHKDLPAVHFCQSPSVIPYFHVGNAHGRIFLTQPLCCQQSMPDHRRCIYTWNLYDRAVKFVWFCPCFTHVWWVFHNIILTKHALGRGFGPRWEWAMALFRKCGQGWKTLIQGYILIPT